MKCSFKWQRTQGILRCKVLRWQTVEHFVSSAADSLPRITLFNVAESSTLLSKRSLLQFTNSNFGWRMSVKHNNKPPWVCIMSRKFFFGGNFLTGIHRRPSEWRCINIWTLLSSPNIWTDQYLHVTHSLLSAVRIKDTEGLHAGCLSLERD